MGLFRNKNVNYQRSTEWAQNQYKNEMIGYADTFWDWANEARDWVQEQYGAIAPTLDQISGNLQDLANTEINAGDDFYNRYWEKYVPVEDKLIDTALNYDTQERRAAESARRQADTAASFEAQREAAKQQFAGLGTDPSQLSYGALDAQWRAQQAAEMALQGNQARQDVENRAIALQSQVAQLGGNQINYANQANQTQLAELQTKGQLQGMAANTAIMPYTTFQNQLGNATGYAAGAVDTRNAAIAGQVNAQTAQNANQMYGRGGGFLGAGLGQLVGTAAGAFAGGSGYGLGASLFGSRGGIVPDLGDPPIPNTTDKTRAVLTPGEFVVDRDTAAWIGQHKLVQQVEKAKMEKQQWAQQQQQQAIPV